uniref:Uncharacterized protein n=1 Tax=Nelumbo nucifera TaxID=4432 RepID=A0A822YZH2_NELNU|nr:TPA_asm: hypothetical protein HUJ06_005248 [Nelumbo nucifera]
MDKVCFTRGNLILGVQKPFEINIHLIFFIISGECVVVFYVSLWQFCNEYAVPKNQLDHFKDVTPQDIVCAQVHMKHFY